VLGIQMKSKTCSKCKKIKDISCFTKLKASSDGLYSYCRDCHKIMQANSHAKNRDKNINRCKKWREKNLVRDKNNKKRYYHKNKEKLRLLAKEYEKKNKQKINERKRNYYAKNKAKMQKRAKEYRQQNLEKTRRSVREYKKRNRNQILARRIENYKKIKDNKTYKLGKTMSQQIRSTLINGSKNKRTWENLVGYTVQDLKNHLESLFEPWMNWENYGQYAIGKPKTWNIDHVIPKSMFKYETPEDEEFKLCWSLKNLQPKGALKNLSKGNRYIG